MLSGGGRIEKDQKNEDESGEFENPPNREEFDIVHSLHSKNHLETIKGTPRKLNTSSPRSLGASGPMSLTVL